MKRLALLVVAGILLVSAAYGGGSGVGAQDADLEPTVEALETRLAEAKATSEARGERINAQRTQIAELEAMLPVVNEDPAIGDVFAIRNFEITIQSTDQLDVVGSFDPQEANGTFLAVFLDVVNVTENPQDFPYREFQVEDGRGRTFSYDSTGSIYYASDVFGGGDLFSPLQPDLSYSVVVVFDVPVDATGFTLTTLWSDFEAPLDR